MREKNNEEVAGREACKSAGSCIATVDKSIPYIYQFGEDRYQRAREGMHAWICNESGKREISEFRRGVWRPAPELLDPAM